MSCPKCGRWVRWNENAGTEATCMGFFSPEGHNHDDNCVVRWYVCASGHNLRLSVRRKCDACDWVGKADCECHDGPKLDAWP